MSSDPPTCLDGGYIAGTRYPLPDDPGVYYKVSNQLIACNRLYCPRCQCFVRVFSGYRRKWPPNEGINAPDLYDAPDPDASPLLQKDEGADLNRVYACRHTTDSTPGFIDAADRDAGWRCAGHPPLA